MIFIFAAVYDVYDACDVSYITSCKGLFPYPISEKLSRKISRISATTKNPPFSHCDLETATVTHFVTVCRSCNTLVLYAKLG